MCSVQEEGEIIPEPKQSQSGPQLCTKCGGEAVIVIRADNSFCKTCFLAHSTHKFRSAFGKSRLVRDGEKVLLAFSGGRSSVAMLHLCQEGKSPRAHKKLRFQPALVFIDESCAYGLSDADAESERNAVIAAMKKSGLPSYIYSIEQAMDPDFINGEVKAEAAVGVPELEEQLGKMSLYGHLKEKLCALLDASKTETARLNLLENLKQRLLVAAARHTGHSKVMVGDSSTLLSIRLLTGVTQGRGAVGAQELSFGDTRYDDIIIVRPLREFLDKEITLYNSLNNLDVILTTSCTGRSGPSLDKLTHDFVTGLQADFPSTVSTVFRTGCKLSGPSDVDKNEKCAFCQCPLDTDVPESSALSATLFSQALCQKRVSNQGKGVESPSSNQETISYSMSKNSSSIGQDCSAAASNESCSCKGSANQMPAPNSSIANEIAAANSSDSSCCGQGDGSCQTKSKVLTRDELVTSLCYGCRLIIKDMKDVGVLPPAVLSEASRMGRRKDMKKSIQDFLIDEDS